MANFYLKKFNWFIMFNTIGFMPPLHIFTSRNPIDSVWYMRRNCHSGCNATSYIHQFHYYFSPQLAKRATGERSAKNSLTPYEPRNKLSAIWRPAEKWAICRPRPPWTPPTTSNARTAGGSSPRPQPTGTYPSARTSRVTSGRQWKKYNYKEQKIKSL